MLAVSGDSTFLGTNPELENRLRQCTNLPSPPGVAAQIIALGQDPVADMGRVADVVSVDPARLPAREHALVAGAIGVEQMNDAGSPPAAHFAVSPTRD